MSEESQKTEERLRELERENEDLRRELLYLKAEVENLKKLMEREVEMARRQSAEGLLVRFIDIYEGLERAIYSDVDEEGRPEVISGLKMLHREMRRLLQEEGVVFLETVGKKFDPFLHEAVGFVEQEGVEDETVIAEVSKGYEYRGKVLRPPRVIVAKKKVSQSA